MPKGEFTSEQRASSIAKRLQNYIVDPVTGCWHFQGYLDPSGYGRISAPAGNGRYIPELAHRLSYEHHIGPIPEGLHVDHTCHNKDKSCPAGKLCKHRRCINPAHLEPVTTDENCRRGRCDLPNKAACAAAKARTHCRKGHLYEEETTILDKNGNRFCAICRARNVRERYEKYKALKKSMRSH